MHSIGIHFVYLLQVQQMAKKDERLKLISEVLNGIKVYLPYVKVCLVLLGYNVHTFGFLRPC